MDELWEWFTSVKFDFFKTVETTPVFEVGVYYRNIF